MTSLAEHARRLLPIAEARQAANLARLPPDQAERIRAGGRWMREQLALDEPQMDVFAEYYRRFCGLDEDEALAFAQEDVRRFPAWLRSLMA